MNSVLKKMTKDKLVALASILDLHNPKKPTERRPAHLQAARGNNKMKAFAELTKDNMIREIKYTVSMEGGHAVKNII